MSILKSRPWIIQVCIAALIAILSFTLLANIAGSVDFHSSTIAELDEQKSTVTTLLASSTAASAVITAIPDDIGTPISDKLAGLSYIFLFILSVLVTEKYLLTLIGVSIFRILIPFACACYILSIIRPGKQTIQKFVQKLVIFCLVVFLLIPVSTLASKTIKDTFHESIEATINAAVSSNESNETAQAEDKGWFQNLIDGVVNSATGALNWAKTVLNYFIEATAVILVTSCLIPLLVFIIFILLLKKLFNLDLPVITIPMPHHKTLPIKQTHND